ncbi:uncharacterized protein LOC128670300 [Plodia interpunctella]|uniref:uncharacterized protein LOC128670300 n=1 Tax=Plodia interpunctella TaxID=58824 RepID=UPI002368D194|nr:uncharacterized protein LOC128670300 [Plodia interpunctella]
MEKVEVDPKLFVTCRLCLDDMGIYQIIPNIQHRIKYCFDIEVAPFDGLPQLICKKCDSKLNEYFTIKTAYVAKQEILIKSLQNKSFKSDISMLPKIAAFVTSQVLAGPTEKETDTVLDKEKTLIAETECTKDNSPPTNHQKTSRRKRIRIESSSSASSESKDSDRTKVEPLIIRKKKSDRGHKWHSINYNRCFSCRMCSKTYIKKNALLKHYSNIHSMCFKKYKSILSSLCTVKMKKVDSKPNFTGVNNAVVLSKDKVMINDESSKYYILYTLKSQNISNDFQPKKIAIQSSDSSDSAQYSVSKKKRRKRSRLLSSDTVVIEKKQDENMSSGAEDHVNNRLINNEITECISLDSDSESEPISGNKTIDGINEDNENKLIRNVIEVCHNKYVRNIAIEKNKRPNYVHLESQLMHKVLNLGRKIVNKQGLNCTGLLRFLEHRNLGIVWVPKTCHSFNGPPVRISMTTIKNDHQRPEDDLGWTDVPYSVNSFRNETSCLKENNRNEACATSKFSNANANLNIANDNFVNVSHEQINPWQSVPDQACLYKYEDVNSTGKLLNENPVANPKQLPKKNVHYETKPNKSVLDKDMELRMESEMNQTLLFSEPSQTANDLTGMPIITSTTSLASDYNKTENTNQRSNSETVNEDSTNSNLSVPRIKVKPVSELMPENVSTPNSLLLNQSNICTFDKRLPNVTPLIPQIPYQPVSVIKMPVSAINNTLPEGQKNNSDYFILNTPEMPNTKTNSPFKYVKALLGIHNIHLVENINTNDFHCLIKFKVLFKQEAVKPIVLCLSLHCDRNVFFIGIRDSTNININMQDLSANWQWEIIKIFQGDVCNKINQTVLKMGLGMHEHSKKFLCLIKSIQMNKIEV